MSIFQGQGYLDIILDTGIDLSGASIVKVLFKKPDGTLGEWTGEVYEDTKVKYEFADEDLDMEGSWRFEAYALIDNRSAYGDIIIKQVKQPLTED